MLYVANMEDINYYNILNVKKNASHDEIRKAYYHISRASHPDKQRQHNNKEITEAFVNITNAYQVLSDPYKREIYDHFGLDGVEVYLANLNKDLETSEIDENKGLTIYDTPINRLVQRMMTNIKELEAAKFHHHLKANCAVMVDINANHFITPPDGYNNFMDNNDNISTLERIDRRVDLFEISSIVFQQSVSANLSSKDTLTIGGYCVTRGGLGYGDVKLTWDSDLDEYTDMRIGTTFGHENSLMCEIGRNITEDDNITLNWKKKRGEDDSTIDLSYKRKLDENTSVIVTASNPFDEIRNSVKVGYETTEGRIKSDYNLSFSPTDIDFNIGKKHTSNDGKTSHKIGFRTEGTRSFGLEFGRTVTLSERSVLATTISFGVSGVKLNLKYARGFMRFVVPITISKVSFIGKMLSLWISSDGTYYLDFDWNDLSYDIWSTLGLFAFSAVLERGYLLRKKQKKKLKNLIKLAKSMSEKREKAHVQQRMIETAARKVELKESINGGLVILIARYGKNIRTSYPWKQEVTDNLDEYHRSNDDDNNNNTATNNNNTETTSYDDDWIDDSDSDEDELYDEDKSSFKKKCKSMYLPSNVDVKIPLQFMVKNSTLSIEPGNRGMLGFYKPNVCIDSILYIRYAYNGKIYEAEFTDLELVLLPSPNAIDTGETFRPVSKEARDALDARKREAMARTRSAFE